MQPNFIIESYGPYVKIIGNHNGNQIVKHTVAEEAIKLFQVQETEAVFQSPLFPFWNVVYKTVGDTHYLLNVEPMTFLRYEVMVRSGQRKKYSFHVPYLYFYWTLNYNKMKKDYAKSDLRVLVSYNPPDMNTNIYYPNLNNIAKTGNLCLGTVDIKGIYQNFNELKTAQNEWITALRNQDLINWDALSKEDGKVFTDEFTWAESGIINGRRKMTIKELINYEN